jgi:hypothetical protein
VRTKEPGLRRGRSTRGRQIAGSRRERQWREMFEAARPKGICDESVTIAILAVAIARRPDRQRGNFDLSSLGRTSEECGFSTALCREGLVFPIENDFSRPDDIFLTRPLTGPRGLAYKAATERGAAEPHGPWRASVSQ